MKFSFSRFLIFSVGVILFLPHASAQIVEIPDPNLERAIREELELSSELPITQQDMLKLFRLRVERMEIENLTGLEYATNLESLILEANQITDLSPLSNLTALQTLRLGHNYIVDISPLANLTQLTDLNLVDNQIKDVGALANLTQLTDLALANNAIRDFRPLFGLNLQSVDIDIHKLQELVSREIEIPDPNLERAIREELGLSSEFPITQQDMLKLFSLSATDMQIENLTGLEYAHNLENLHIPGNPIQDLSPIASLTQLRFLNLAGIRIKDLTFLSNLTQLQKITMVSCVIRDTTPLANLTQLISLNIGDNWIVDISPIANLTRLEKLRIHGNLIVDISPLANLTALKELWLERNRVLDFSPIQGLSLTDFRYDEVCLLPDPPIRDRIENRSLPSIFQGWRGGTNLSPLSPEDFISHHDLYWTASLFGLRFLDSPLGYTPAGVIEDAIVSREEYLAKNSNMIFLLQIRINTASYSQFPEDWFGWVRDENGNPVRSDPHFRDGRLMDMRLPEVQDIIVQQAAASSTCGLYDGIMFDWWPDDHFILTSYNADGSVRDRELVEENIALSIIQRIRANVPEDFLILCNTNWDKLPITGSYINGSFMETYPIELGKGYTRPRIAEIEDTLLWFEENAREPQITCLRVNGIPTELPDSPTNRRQMRLFTTMSLTLSDGYVMYTTGARTQLLTLATEGRWFGEHIWYPFWDADLGQPVGPIAQRYRDVDGLYIREFTNGWAVYNRSGASPKQSHCHHLQPLYPTEETTLRP